MTGTPPVARWILSLLVLVMSSGALHCAAAESDPKAEAAVAAALEFLAKQQADDGSFPASPGSSAAAESLLAMLSAGQIQDVGRYGLVVRRAVDFLLRSAPEDRYFGKTDKSGMYGQAIVTIALCEAFSTEPDPSQRNKIRAIVERSVTQILKFQDIEKPQPLSGGWSDDPESTQSNLTSTVWCMLGLRAARNIGLPVAKSSFDGASEFVKRCAIPQSTGFADHPGGEASPVATAAGALVLRLFSNPEQNVTSIVQPTSGPSENSVSLQQALFTIASMQDMSDPTSTVSSPIHYRVVSGQQADGSWTESEASPQRIHATSFAIVTLTRPLRYLMTFER